MNCFSCVIRGRSVTDSQGNWVIISEVIGVGRILCHRVGGAVTKIPGS